MAHLTQREISGLMSLDIARLYRLEDIQTWSIADLRSVLVDLSGRPTHCGRCRRYMSGVLNLLWMEDIRAELNRRGWKLPGCTNAHTAMNKDTCAPPMKTALYSPSSLSTSR